MQTDANKAAFTECVIKELERRLEERMGTLSGEFKVRDIANTLWAYAALGMKPGVRAMEALERRLGEISGDFNAQVGSANESDNQDVIGLQGVFARTERGQRLVEWCSIHDLMIANTFFSAPPTCHRAISTHSHSAYCIYSSSSSIL